MKAHEMLEDRRKQLSVSHELLARRSGLTRPTLANYLSGQTDIPLSVFFRLCAVLLIEPKLLEQLYEDSL